MSDPVDAKRFETAIDIIMEHFRETEERMAALEEQLESLQAQLNAVKKERA
jgi:AmiR/NasT family two-component response regulator